METGMDRRTSWGGLRIGVIVLTIATASVHLVLGLVSLQTMGPIFILNGLGYLMLLAALYAPLRAVARFRRSIRWTLLGYTTLTVALWLLMGARDAVAYVDKAFEVLLIGLLLAEALRERRAAPASSAVAVVEGLPARR